MSHEEFVGGEDAFEIDHHHPQAKGGPRTAYDNLFLSCARCNRNKGDEWPDRATQGIGIRYLNPCLETDYGQHIFEGENGELIPHSKAAEYHVEMIALNRVALIRSRRKRRQLAQRLLRLRSGPVKMKTGDMNRLTEALDMLKADLEKRIPLIAPPPKPQPVAS